MKLIDNMMLKISILKYGKYIDFFFLKKKMWVAFATQSFAANNINVFENTLATTINEFDINKLIKLTMLWTIGPCYFGYITCCCCKAHEYSQSV